MAKALTARAVEAAKAETKRREIPDGALPGLYLVVQESGAKSWAVRYRAEGKQRKLTVGRYPGLTLGEARDSAREALRAVTEGGDPAAEKRVARAATAPDPDRNKVRTLVELYERRKLADLRDGRLVRRYLDKEVVARWGDRDAGDVTRRDIIEMLDAVLDDGRPVAANRVLAYTRAFFNWLVDRDVIEAAPTAGVKPPTKEAARDRVLSDEEVRWFWRACDAAGPTFGSLGKLLLLTGQRLAEVAEMTEDEIDGDVWRLAAERTKNGRPHDVPLAPAALATLAKAPRVTGPAGFVFTTTGRTPVSGFSKFAARLRIAMAEAAAEERGEPVAIPHWTLHDLRRTAASGMARLGVPLPAVEKVLNHVSGSFGGIVSVYQKHGFAEEKRAALTAWAAHVERIVAGEGAENVVPLRGAN